MAGMASGPSTVEAITLARTFVWSAPAHRHQTRVVAVAHTATVGWSLKFIAAVVACKTTTRCLLLSQRQQQLPAKPLHVDCFSNIRAAIE